MTVGAPVAAPARAASAKALPPWPGSSCGPCGQDLLPYWPGGTLCGATGIHALLHCCMYG
jgi:hypothetical protein